jgi:ATP-dependent Lon protease
MTPTPTNRKANAEAAVSRLRAEQAQLHTQQKRALESIERLNRDIAQAQRSSDPDTLASLRTERRTAEETARDVRNALPILERELEQALGERHMAERAVQAERFNAIQAKQAALLATITEAVDQIVDAIKEKETLAGEQQRIVQRVCPGADRNAALIRHDLADCITARLQGQPATALRARDWTAWVMSEQGDLLR